MPDQAYFLYFFGCVQIFEIPFFENSDEGVVVVRVDVFEGSCVGVICSGVLLVAVSPLLGELCPILGCEG